MKRAALDIAHPGARNGGKALRAYWSLCEARKELYRTDLPRAYCTGSVYSHSLFSSRPGQTPPEELPPQFLRRVTIWRNHGTESASRNDHDQPPRKGPDLHPSPGRSRQMARAVRGSLDVDRLVGVASPLVAARD